jgi:hypothetical protein
MSRLSILTVSRCEPHSLRFLTHFRAVADILDAPFVLACDRCDPPPFPTADKTLLVECKTTIEDVLAEVHLQCETPWVLRLDDDETLTAHAIEWLSRWIRVDDQASAKAIAFPRANLWGSHKTRLDEEGLWPDFQVRLIRREFETRDTLHQGLGVDLVSPAAILHHKFLVKGREERESIADRYEATWEGAGRGEHYVRFTLPENVFGENPRVASVV